ncbi:NRDE family protein [Nonomuraea sp. NPDC046570]|uniref:NRDE family protein n=1 Tax=Nonomuraea sp. NPDC046570 TaxID=3155255 RepID=UPI0034089524
MCTVIVKTGDPLTLLGVRDEFADRPWQGPGEYWPDHPGVIGGRDLEAGGTWLAVDPVTRRAAALLNGWGRPADESTRTSRGDLPLLALDADGLPDVDLTRYDPFHLVLASPAGAWLWSWDGEAVTSARLPDGTSVIVNSGLDEASPKVAALRPLFDAAIDWRAPMAADPTDDLDALVIRHELPDGRVYATLSATLLTLGEDGVGYDFSDLTGWNSVSTSRVDRGVSPHG